MVECVNFDITDWCNRACPDCCCDVPRIKEHWDVSMQGVVRAGEYMHGIRRVTLAGGEPTLHPGFEWIARNAKRLFGCESLEIATNGKMTEDKIEFLGLFDVIWVTRYGPPEFEESNAAYIAKIEKHIAEIEKYVSPPILKIDPNVVHHVPRSHRGSGSCERGAGITVALYKDRVYPCCMGWGIGTSESVQISENWEAEVMALPRPCKDCFFS